MFDFLGDIGSAVMTPLYYFVSGIMLVWHRLFSLVLHPDSGWTWALSIVGLTITIRAMLIPLFVKQINSSRNMQLIQPQLQELRKKYGHDRERFAQEQMKLFQETGTNPFSSCMPLLLQMPIFFALFRVINKAAHNEALGFLSQADAESLSSAKWLGGDLASSFTSSDNLETKIIAMGMVIAMCLTQFLTQKQLMTKNMTPEALNGPFAQQQKMLLYILPVVFAVSGVAFPLGVLVYWTTSNLWTMGQQFWVIRNNPAPGTPAFAAKQERDRAKGKKVQEDPLKSPAPEVEEKPKNPPRQQPKKKTRDQRRKSTGSNPPPNTNDSKNDDAKEDGDE